VLAGESLTSVCRDFEKRDIRTPAGRHWLPTTLRRLGRIELVELASRDIVRMFAVLAGRRNRYGEQIASSTLHRIRATLRAALNAAVREGLITSNPAR
jgi:hypothetical protein